MNTKMHDEAESWAAAAATGGLAENELKAWNEHVASCPACKKTNDEETAMANFIKGKLGPEAPDPGFEQRILHKLRQADAFKGNRWYEYVLFHPGLAGAMACVVAAACIVLAVHNTNRPVVSANPPGFDALPTVVQGAIRSRTGLKTVSKIENGQENGEAYFTVSTKEASGGESEFTLAGDGTLLSSDTTLDAVPPAVRDAIDKQMENGSLAGISEDFDAAETTYRAGITAPGGDERDYTFAKDGTLLEAETTMAELPAALQSAIQSKAAGGTLGSVRKTFENGETDYVATVISGDGRQHDYTFTGNGTLSSAQMIPDELPAVIRNAVAAQAGGHKVCGIDKVFDGGDASYDVTVAGADGSQRVLTFSEEGQLLSREVAMSDAPQAVQQPSRGY